MSFCEIHFLSQTLSQNVSATVFLPEENTFGKSAIPPYRTVYFLPGYSGDYTSLYTMLSFRKQAELKGIAIVIPNGQNGFYIDHPERNANYSRFVGEELVARTRTMFRLSEKREDTYIAGISMGGYGALLNGLRYRSVFSKIAAFSPAADPALLMGDPEACRMGGFGEREFEYYFSSAEEYHAGPWDLMKLYPEAAAGKSSADDVVGDPAVPLPELFVGCGDRDIAVDSQVRRFEECLINHNIPHIFRESYGNHDIDTWEEMMDPAFSFLAGVPEGKYSSLRLPDFTGAADAIVK